MSHTRKRYLTEFYRKQTSFWPVVGLMGMRQVGKTTFIQQQSTFKSIYTFDDDDVRNDAMASAKAFVGKLEKPTALDEAQKAPPIFDAIKSFVDKKRVPGMFTLSGSSAFNSFKDIRESLTGRMGLCQVFPMTYAEANQFAFRPLSSTPLWHLSDKSNTLIPIEKISAQIQKGGLPVPLFARDSEMRAQYWRGWLDTTLGRDLFRVYGKGYDPDIAALILDEIATAMREGEMATVSHLSVKSTKALKYLGAMCSVYLLNRLKCHPSGVGRDVYRVSDSGLANYLAEYKTSPEVTLSLSRVFIQNEIEARLHYSGETFKRIYFKSAKGSPVDFVWNKIPIKITNSLQALGWERRALEGAMKTLKSPTGILVAPTDQLDIPKNQKGVAVVPWSYWS